ncbi:putative Triosephosphate isomerase [Cocos nucifera]|uniref:Putative Triosephosphate isomerase n=1 Tax=Cocos nucifera TaxID=13894 RepID=A0A8K0IVR9_COCNU|nr:putative Triosephosphate isomerase [Cocos nucifera]
MAKNRNKKKNSPVSMNISAEDSIDAPQAMDTSEGKPSNPALGATDRKIKKTVQVKRSNYLRKLKGIARAITNSEKYDEKLSKNKNKMVRVQSAKLLYD